MNVGLFIPCYVNQFYPNARKATYNLLKKLGCKNDFPMQQTYCGQLLSNNGFQKENIKSALHFIKIFSAYDYIVAPSGSCVHYIKENYTFISQSEELKNVHSKIYELSEFLVNILKVEDVNSVFP